MADQNCEWRVHRITDPDWADDGYGWAWCTTCGRRLGWLTTVVVTASYG